MIKKKVLEKAIKKIECAPFIDDMAKDVYKDTMAQGLDDMSEEELYDFLAEQLIVIMLEGINEAKIKEYGSNS